MHGKRALVRRPSPRLAEGLLTHLERSPVDADRAMAQWDGYVRAVIDAGWAVVEVEPAPDCPDSGFVEDTMVVYGDVAIISRLFPLFAGLVAGFMVDRRSFAHLEWYVFLRAILTAIACACLYAGYKAIA